MKLLNSNLKKGEIRVQTQNQDDLWYLSTIIEPKDIVQGKSARRIKAQSNDERSRQDAKKQVFLAIEVEKVEFSKSSSALRVLGVIKQAPEDIKLGEHHAFSIEDNTIITIIKEKWLKYQLDKLKDACLESKSSILICVHDREEAYLCLFKKYGYEILSHIKGEVAKKVDENIKKENFYLKIIKKITEYTEKHNITQIIIASPSFWKENLMKEVKDESLKQKIILATCSSATQNGIEEVMKRPEVREALRQERAAIEINKVEELLAQIAKNSHAVYGIKETKDAAAISAIKELLVTDGMIQKSRSGDFYSTIEDIMKKVDAAGGDIQIISSDHEGGKRLDGLGGIGAILRFKLKY